MEVRLFATLRDGRGKVVDIEWREGMDGRGLFAELGIPEEDVALFIVNGAHSKPENKLAQCDVIALFPPVGGG